MTPQQKMQAALAKTGIPVKEIKVFGSQILITAWSHDAAKKWAAVLTKFATVRAVVESVDYDKINTGSVNKPSTHKVWRVGAHI